MGVKKFWQFLKEHHDEISESVTLSPSKSSSGSSSSSNKTVLCDGYGFLISFAQECQQMLTSPPPWLKLAAASQEEPTTTASAAAEADANLPPLLSLLYTSIRNGYNDADICGGDARLVSELLRCAVDTLQQRFGLELVFAIDAPRGIDDWADEHVSPVDVTALQQRHKIWTEREQQRAAQTQLHHDYASRRVPTKHGRAQNFSKHGSSSASHLTLPLGYLTAARAALPRGSVQQLDTEVDEQIGQLVQELRPAFVLSSDTDFPVILGRQHSASAGGGTTTTTTMLSFLQNFPFVELVTVAVRGIIAGQQQQQQQQQQPLTLSVVSIPKLHSALGVPKELPPPAADLLVRVAASMAGNDITMEDREIEALRGSRRINELVTMCAQDREFMASLTTGTASSASSSPLVRTMVNSTSFAQSMQQYAAAASAEGGPCFSPAAAGGHSFWKTKTALQKRVRLSDDEGKRQKQQQELDAFFTSIATGTVPSHFLVMLLFDKVYRRPPPYVSLGKLHEQCGVELEQHCQSLLAAQRRFLLQGDEAPPAGAALRCCSPASQLQESLMRFFGLEPKHTLDAASFISMSLAVAVPALHANELAFLAMFLHLQLLPPEQSAKFAAAASAIFDQEAAEFLDERPAPRCLELTQIVAYSCSAVASAAKLFGFVDDAVLHSAATLSFGTLFHVMFAIHVANLDEKAAASATFADMRALQRTISWTSDMMTPSSPVAAVAPTLQTLEHICKKWQQQKQKQKGGGAHVDLSNLAAALGCKPGSSLRQEGGGGNSSSAWVGSLRLDNDALVAMMDEGSADQQQGLCVGGGGRHGEETEEVYPQQQQPQKELPIEKHLPQILRMINNHRVSILRAETGAGKSSMVPLALLQESPVNEIIVTQPRRLAAQSLARRVASLLGEKVGVTVGYRLGGGAEFHCESKNTRLRFVTTGYLLEAVLSLTPTCWSRCTHLILDECHERSLQADMLSLVAKLMLAPPVPPAADDDDEDPASPAGVTGTPLLHDHAGQPAASRTSAFAAASGAVGNEKRLVIMSATVQSAMFRNYFKPLAEPLPISAVEALISESTEHDVYEDLVLSEIATAKQQYKRQKSQQQQQQQPQIQFVPSYFVGASCFPVKILYFDEAKKTLAGKLPRESVAVLDQVEEKIKQVGRRNVLALKSQPVVSAISTLILAVAAPGSVLVFVPGLEEIETLIDFMATRIRSTRSRVQIRLYALHSIVDHKTQEEITAPAPPGVCKVIFGTNILETSITVSDAHTVIDAGQQRRMQFDEQRGVRKLGTTHVSRSGAKQRAGRVGRTAPGLVIRLYLEKHHGEIFASFDPSEILPLDYSLLQIRGSGLSTFGTIESVVQQLIEPPSAAAVAASLAQLVRAGALSAPPLYAVEPLGRVALALPVDISSTRMILTGASLGVAAELVIVAAGLAVPRALLQRPLSTFFRGQEGEFSRSIAAVFKGRDALFSSSSSSSSSAESRSDLSLFTHIYEIFGGLSSDQFNKRWIGMGARNFMAMSQVRTFLKYVTQVAKCLLDVCEKQQQQQHHHHHKGKNNTNQHRQHQARTKQAADQAVAAEWFGNNTAAATAASSFSSPYSSSSSHPTFSAEEDLRLLRQLAEGKRVSFQLSPPRRLLRVQIVFGTASAMQLTSTVKINDSNFFRILAKNNHVDLTMQHDALAEVLSRTAVLQNMSAEEFKKLGLSGQELKEVVMAQRLTDAEQVAAVARQHAERKVARVLAGAFDLKEDDLQVTVDLKGKNVMVTFPSSNRSKSNNSGGSTAIHPLVHLLTELKMFHSTRRCTIPLGGAASATGAATAAASSDGWAQQDAAEPTIELNPARFVSLTAQPSGVSISTTAEAGNNEHLVSKVTAVSSVKLDRWCTMAVPSQVFLHKSFVYPMWAMELTLLGDNFAVERIFSNAFGPLGHFLTSLATPAVAETLFATRSLCCGIKNTKQDQQQQQKQQKGNRNKKQQQQQQQKKKPTLEQGMFIVSIVPGHIAPDTSSSSSRSSSSSGGWSYSDSDDDLYLDSDDEIQRAIPARREQRREGNAADVAMLEKRVAQVRPNQPQLLGLTSPLHCLLEANLLLALLWFSRQSPFLHAAQKQLVLNALDEMLRIGTEKMPALNDPSLMSAALATKMAWPRVGGGGLDPAVVLGGEKTAARDKLDAAAMVDGYCFLPLKMTCVGHNNNSNSSSSDGAATAPVIPLFDVSAIFSSGELEAAVPKCKLDIYERVFSVEKRERVVVVDVEMPKPAAKTTAAQNDDDDDDDDDDEIVVGSAGFNTAPAAVATAPPAAATSIKKVLKPTAKSSSSSTNNGIVRLGTGAAPAAAASAAATTNNKNDDDDDESVSSPAQAQTKPPLGATDIAFCNVCALSIQAKQFADHKRSDAHIHKCLQQNAQLPGKWRKQVIPATSTPFGQHIFFRFAQEGKCAGVPLLCLWQEEQGRLA